MSAHLHHWSTSGDRQRCFLSSILPQGEAIKICRESAQVVLSFSAYINEAMSQLETNVLTDTKRVSQIPLTNSVRFDSVKDGVCGLSYLLRVFAQLELCTKWLLAAGLRNLHEITHVSE